MAGLVPAIRVFLGYGDKDVDARHKAGMTIKITRCRIALKLVRTADS
jgi:hypothetical protein